ncbi:MAG: polyprenyl synthetase family protein [Bacteroidetes bacterium]|nr:polyprenyl synthetase family protein [Bacteroidota bacterium]
MSNSYEELSNLITEKINKLNFIKEPESLYIPVDYCLKNGGKRIRPLMTLLGCKLFGGNTDDAVNAAIGLELLHNFTLMHDDIMDEAPIRRGQPSVYKKWGTNTAILSGDAMLVLAYNHILEVPEDKLKAILEVFNTSITEVCEGQQYDMDFETRKIVSEDEYLNMIRLKTAVLPANCLKIGAMISGNASEEDIFNLYKFGEYFGLAFQIQDDWLDIYSDEKVFGKKTGGDILAKKKTWLFIKALSKADDKLKKTLTDAFYSDCLENNEKISIVKSVYNALNISNIAIREIELYFNQALSYLDKINVDDEDKKPLRDLAKGLMNREY